MVSKASKESSAKKIKTSIEDLNKNKNKSKNKNKVGGSKNSLAMCQQTSFESMNKQMGGGSVYGNYKISHQQTGGSDEAVKPPLELPGTSANPQVPRSDVPTKITPDANNEFVYPTYYKNNYNPPLTGGAGNLLGWRVTDSIAFLKSK